MEQFNVKTLPLEESLATLENAKHALVTPSGMSAIQTVLQTYLSPGDHILVNEDMYSKTLKLLRIVYEGMNVECEKIDMTDLNSLKRSIRPSTRIVLLESPSNPMMKICDIKSIVKITRELNKNSLIVADNTMMTCLLQSPLELGADIVIYSLTKYINGHQDIVMGSVITNDSEIFEKLKATQCWNGFIPSKWNCSMVERGLKTLKLRLAKHGENARKVVDFLKKSNYVAEVFTGNPDTSENKWIHQQMKGCNGMVSFRLKDDSDFAKKVLKNLKIIIIGESYAGCESLICVP